MKNYRYIKVTFLKSDGTPCFGDDRIYRAVNDTDHCYICLFNGNISQQVSGFAIDPDKFTPDKKWHETSWTIHDLFKKSGTIVDRICEEITYDDFVLECL
jgi:hypothetical protein